MDHETRRLLNKHCLYERILFALPEDKEKILKENSHNKFLHGGIIIDDNCYMNGKQVSFTFDLPYIIVVGPIGVGKSLYSKFMSEYDKGVQYVSVQRLSILQLSFRSNAQAIISIDKQEVVTNER